MFSNQDYELDVERISEFVLSEIDRHGDLERSRFAFSAVASGLIPVLLVSSCGQNKAHVRAELNAVIRAMRSCTTRAMHDRQEGVLEQWFPTYLYS